jgi:hypothetical protein
MKLPAMATAQTVHTVRSTRCLRVSRSLIVVLLVFPALAVIVIVFPALVVIVVAFFVAPPPARRGGLVDVDDLDGEFPGRITLGWPSGRDLRLWLCDCVALAKFRGRRLIRRGGAVLPGRFVPRSDSAGAWFEERGSGIDHGDDGHGDGNSGDSVSECDLFLHLFLLRRDFSGYEERLTTENWREIRSDLEVA